MEILGSFLDEEWDSLSKMFSINGENLDFLLHCDGSGSSSLFSSYGEIPSSTSENVFFPSNIHNFDANFCCISQESSNTSENDRALFPKQGDEDHHQHFFPDEYVTNNTFDDQSMNFCNMDWNINHSLMMPVFSDDVMEEILHLKKGENRPAETGDFCTEMQLKRKYEEEEEEAEIQITQEKDKSAENYSTESPKKIPRVSRNAQKSRTALQSKKNKKKIQDNNNEEDQCNAGGNKQSSSSYSSEDDSNASQELNGGSTSESKGSASLNSHAKTRANRGSATDPQSLYARRRRERINERLKILQNLVPNGTKVDISTMLEEAVQYVKFLQLQIKLLSSDDLWMYAPIAYNGMDIGFYQKISPNLRPEN